MFQRIFEISHHLDNLPFTRHRTLDRIFYTIYNGSDLSQPNPFQTDSELYKLLLRTNDDNKEMLNNQTIYICKVIYMSHFLNMTKKDIDDSFSFVNGNIIKKEKEDINEMMLVFERRTKESNYEKYIDDMANIVVSEDGKTFECLKCKKHLCYEKRYRHFESSYHKRRIE